MVIVYDMMFYRLGI